MFVMTALLSGDGIQDMHFVKGDNEMNYHFAYLDKQCLEQMLPKLFQLLHTNMTLIAPTGNTYEQDFGEWYGNVYPAMQKEPRQIVLMYDGDTMVGYFQYYVAKGVFMMEEIQIQEAHQGTGLFRAFYVWLLKQIKEGVQYVEAYSHKKNRKSQGILEHLGLSQCGENQNGNSYHYRGNYKDLVNVFF